MKNWTSKKKLRITVEALREENSELQRQLAEAQKEAKQQADILADVSFDLAVTHKRIDTLTARLSKFDRQRGAGGKYVKKIR